MPTDLEVLFDYGAYGQIQKICLPQNGQEAVFDIYAVKMNDV